MKKALILIGRIVSIIGLLILFISSFIVIRPSDNHFLTVDNKRLGLALIRFGLPTFIIGSLLVYIIKFRDYIKRKD